MFTWKLAILTGISVATASVASAGEIGGGISRVGIGPGGASGNGQGAYRGPQALPGDSAYERALHIERYHGTAASIGALERAADAGSAAAMTRLGLMYVRGEGVAADEGLGLALVRQAAMKEDPAAMLALASAYHHGEGVERDEVQARYWLVHASETGYRPAMEARRRLAAP